MSRYLLIILLAILVNVSVTAANDPMVSLFKFQSQMAKGGNVDAMMKLGEMYEQGVGTKQDLNKALEMYQQAQVKGKKEAATAIKRVERTKKYGATPATKQRATQDKAARDKATRDKATRDKAARDKAARDKAARDKAARDKAARDKAARDKAARDKAARDKAARDKAARDKATQDKAAQDKAARKKAAEKKTGEGFTSDPCNTPAARFMSKSCRKKK